MTIMKDRTGLRIQNDQPVILCAGPDIPFCIFGDRGDKRIRDTRIRIWLVPRIMNKVSFHRVETGETRFRADPYPMMTVPEYTGDIVAPDRTRLAVTMLIPHKAAIRLIQHTQPAV